MTFALKQIAVFGVAVLLSPVLLPAQDPSQQSTPATTQDSGANIGEMSQAMRDKMFLQKATEGGIAEVKLGQLAAQKGSSDEVKTFGQKMVDDHTVLNTDIASVADTMGVRLPKTITKEDQAEYDKLSGLSGSDFDREYLIVMVKAHHTDLHAFRMAADHTGDSSLGETIAKALRVIREHTIMVDKLARDKGVPMPPRPGTHSS